jgi:hypothetical protein
MEHMPERYHLAMYLFRDVFDGDLISYQQIRLIHSTEYVDKLLEATPEIQTRVKAVSKLFTHGIDTNFGIKYE